MKTCNDENRNKEIEGLKIYHEKYNEAVDKFDEIFNDNKNADKAELKQIIVSEIRKADPDKYAVKYCGDEKCTCDGLLSIKKMTDFEENLEDVKEIYRKYRRTPIIFFPSEYNGINTSRARNRRINDRIDYTLYDLKKYFASDDNCILKNSYNLPKTKRWLDTVETFENLIDWLGVKGIFTDNDYNVYDIENGTLIEDTMISGLKEDDGPEHPYTKKYYENLKKKIDEFTGESV